MKQNHQKNLIQQQIFKAEQEYFENEGSSHNSSPRVVVYPGTIPAIGPNPPTAEAILNAQFIDKTYVWNKK
jgi:hypothetical protein